MKPLEGKRALVVGCEGRLGPVWMRALSDAGADVMGGGPPACDLRYPFLFPALTTPDVLVVNAGVDSRPGTPHNPQDMVAVNVLGVQYVLETVGRDMCRGGSIVLIASLYGLVAPDMRYYNHRPDGWVKDPLYGATKAAIIQLTRDFAARYGPYGIRVNAIAPGGVIDPTDPLTVGDPEFQSKYTARIPLGRMCQPSDLGGPLVFLASDASSFMTGQTLVLDGGYTCW